jgi:predicted ribosome quality control (RQC) complex YloA/Tae2 family protein
MPEGVYISSLVPVIEERIGGRRCIAVDAPARHGIRLAFPDGCLLLSAVPDSPGVWWEEKSVTGLHQLPVWSDHLAGASVRAVHTHGVDRVLEIEFDSDAPYTTSALRLILEATGRNGNLILVRSKDSRILACMRKITSERCRYRAIVPGCRYQPPPPSGLPPEQWSTSQKLMTALSGEVSERDIFELLEGVGPVTSRALIEEARSASTSVFEQVCRLADSMIRKRFYHWNSPYGPLPQKLGPGVPLQDPLGFRAAERQTAAPELDELCGMLRKEQHRLIRKSNRLEEAIRNMVPDEVYRNWGNLLLMHSEGIEKGQQSVALEDWNGNQVEIPLKPARGAVENAQRFFRKAGKTRKERDNLVTLLDTTTNRISEIDEILRDAHLLEMERLRKILGVERKRRRSKGKPALHEVMLASGWRCFTGSNARDNDRITFQIGRKGDLWFHARGVGGAHVILKRNGRADNPSATALMEAAYIAALNSSGVSRGVIPVDYTLVQYVRKFKGGKPGQVVYTREKTLFVDLDR